MSARTESAGEHGTPASFTKTFVMGLVVGVIIGGFAGAFLPPLLDGYRRLPPDPTPSKDAGRSQKEPARDERSAPQTPTETEHVVPAEQPPAATPAAPEKKPGE